MPSRNGVNVTWLLGFPKGDGNCVVHSRLHPSTDDSTADPRSGGHLLQGDSRRFLDPDMVTTASKRRVIHLKNVPMQLELCSFHVSCPLMLASGYLSVHRNVILSGPPSS